MYFVATVRTTRNDHGPVFEVRCTDGRVIRATQQRLLAVDVAYCANAGNVTIRHIPGFGAVRVRH